MFFVLQVPIYLFILDFTLAQPMDFVRDFERDINDYYSFVSF